MNARSKLGLTVLGREILRQPTVLGTTFNNQRPQVESVAHFLTSKRIGVVDVVAIGSSKNAALVARHLLGKRLILNVQEPTDYLPTSPILFLVSQSGESSEINRLLLQLRAHRSKSKGGLTIFTITNTPGSTLDKSADIFIHTHAGNEKSIAATGTMTSIILTFYHLGGLLPNASASINANLESIQTNLRTFLDEFSYLSIQKIVENLKQTGYLAVLGRGLMLGVAAEAALKIGETAEIVTSYGSIDIFRHGYVAPFGARTEPTRSIKKSLLILPQYEDAFIMRHYMRLAAENGFHINYLLSNLLSNQLNSFNTAIFSIVLCQIIAHDLAVAKGITPGTSSILRKVVL
ncbi:MAG: SIS domain-containing protein [Candidatus Micrarchaeota archaeon]|nr:SIS domain-containing protein [Candidatus Micrarchaeota archaeon]